MSLRRYCMALPAAILLVGCSGQDQTELRSWMAEQTKGMRGGVAALPEIKPLEAVAYLGQDLTVPFSPQKIVTAEPAGKDANAKTDRVRQPLENFPLEDLQVQGVIVVGKRPYALIQPKPPNKPMHIGVGDYMGQDLGKVKAITPDGVVLMETFKDNNGVWTEREVVKQVPREGGSK